jgi:hypothetical protein
MILGVVTLVRIWLAPLIDPKLGSDSSGAIRLTGSSPGFRCLMVVERQLDCNKKPSL